MSDSKCCGQATSAVCLCEFHFTADREIIFPFEAAGKIYLESGKTLSRCDALEH